MQLWFRCQQNLGNNVNGHLVIVIHHSCGADEPAERAGGERHRDDPGEGGGGVGHLARRDHLLHREPPPRRPIRLPLKLARHLMDQVGSINLQIAVIIGCCDTVWSIQGDPSGCTIGFVDIKTICCHQYLGNILIITLYLPEYPNILQ